MDVIDPGHVFLLDVLDGNRKESLTFVKRNDPPEKYPGNTDSYSGTTIQEVLRALISRVKYQDNQIPNWNNKHLLKYLREGISVLESRNSEKKGQPHIKVVGNIEDMSTCPKCLHIDCQEHKDEL